MRNARWLTSADSVQAVDRIADAIGEEVLTGRLAPGEVITPRRLMDQFSASTEVVLTALSRLEDEGFVTAGTGGFVVPSIDQAEIRQAYRLRTMLEPLLAAEMVQTITEEQFAQLKEAVSIRNDATADFAERRRANLEIRRLATLPADLAVERQALLTAWQPLDRLAPIVATMRPTVLDMPWAHVDEDFLDAYSRHSVQAVQQWYRDYHERYWRATRMALELLDAPTNVSQFPVGRLTGRRVRRRRAE